MTHAKLKRLNIASRLAFIKAHENKRIETKSWLQDWRAYIEACQLVTHYETKRAHKLVARIAWSGKGNCHDCNCKRGQLHAIGCDMERDEQGAQIISCGKYRLDY